MTPESIVKTKLFPPKLAGQIIAREKLLKRLIEARRLRCVVLQGPAGCGKTTTATSWRQALLPLGFDLAWLTLSADDNEVSRWLDYLIASFSQIDPALASEASLLAGRGVDSEAVERALVALVQKLGQRGRDVTLFLDDLHHLTDVGGRWALQWLIDNAPANLHFVLISRLAAPVSLARVRDHGQALELNLRDLRFSLEESGAFLTAQLGAIAERDLQTIYERTDGWAAGLQLLSIGWKKSQATGSNAPTRAADRSMVRDAKTFATYFEQEVLSHLSASEMDLLVRASACTRFCASLCAAMLERPEAVAAAAAVLARLERDNVFILPVESAEREGWYRLHPLLGEALRGRFDQLSEAKRRRAHEAAWSWFGARGHIDDAVRHAVRAGRSEAAADLLERYAQDLYARGNIRSLLRLVRQLPPEHIQSRTTLRLWLGRSQLFAREFEACAASIEQLRAEIPESDVAGRYALALLHAALAIQRDDSAEATAILPTLLEAPADADASTIGGRNNILSWLYLRRGEFEQARRIQLDAQPLLVDGAPLLGTAAGSLQGLCLIGLSYALEGRVLEAERHFRDALHTAEQNGPACSDAASLATAFLGEVLYELNDIGGVLRLLESRVDILERISIPDSVLRVLLALSGAHWAAGRELDALAYLERLEEYATSLSLDRLLAHSLGEQARRRVQRGEFDKAKRDLARLQALAERRLQIGDNSDEVSLIAARARTRWRLAMGDLASASAGLDALIEQGRIGGRQQFLAQFIMLKAAVAHRSGQSKEARAHLLEALTLGRRLGLVRSLLDTDPAAETLIQGSATDESLDPLLAFYIERLCQAAPKGAPSLAKATGKVVLSLEPLSEREIEVVKLLAKALPNKTIARTLGLSPETVKWHLKNIYGKLGVSGRDDAIARMRDIEVA